MARKVYLKPPSVTGTALKIQVVVGVLFLFFGLAVFSAAQGEARPFVAIFGLIWVVGCIGIIVQGVKGLRLIKEGKIEIAELDDVSEAGPENGFASRIRALEELRTDRLISEEEYHQKRAEIMREKW